MSTGSSLRTDSVHSSARSMFWEQTCMMSLPQTVTARASGLSRRPPQEGHGRCAMKRWISERT